MTKYNRKWIWDELRCTTSRIPVLRGFNHTQYSLLG